MEKFVEAADERFIFQAQPPDHGIEALANLMRILLFQVVVKKYDHRQWESLGGEHIDLLFHIIFKHAEFVALQVRNEIAGTVLHRDGQNDQVGVHADFGSRVAWRWSSG